MRYAAVVEYDGRPFCGWQRQPHAPSVQACVEQALSHVAAEPIKVQCAGRTDTGLHALGQVIHFDTQVDRSLRSWLLGANSNLPESIAIQRVQPMSEDFHARFSARARSYRYVISNQVSRPALLVGKATWCVKPLDVERMQQAANSLLGKHDFTSFRALACQANTPIRTLHELRLRREGSLVILDVTANAFLHHMVRNLAGVLMAIGSGEREVSWAAELLQQRDRSQAGVTAKPDGLYFLAVQYDSQFDI